MPAVDKFETNYTRTAAPIDSAFDVTPSDGTDVAFVTRGLMVTVAGDVAVTMHGDDTDITLTGLLVGVVYPFRVSRIWATDTTATGIKAFY